MSDTTGNATPKATLQGRAPEVLEALATWEMFRRLGFKSEVIDVGVQDGKVVAQISIQGQAPKVVVGRTSMSPEAFQTAWEALADEMSGIPEQELDALWETSGAKRNGHIVCESLVELGIYWPNHPSFHMEMH